MGELMVHLLFFKKKLFIGLCRVLVACSTRSLLHHVGSFIEVHVV